MLLVNQKQITDYSKNTPIMQEYAADKEAIREEFKGMDYVIVRSKDTPPPDSQGNVYETPPFIFPLISEPGS